MKLKKPYMRYALIVGGLCSFLITHYVGAAQAFGVACDLIANNLRVNNGLVACQDALVCGNLTVNGTVGSRGIGYLSFSANDIGFSSCGQTNLTLAQLWVQNTYPDCGDDDYFSEIRGVPLYTAAYATTLATLSVPTLPYLDFALPTDLDNSGASGMQVDLHFFTMCADATSTVDEVIVSGPPCGGAAETGNVSVNMIADFISNGGVIGAACGEMDISAAIVSVTSPTTRTTFRHYVVTFCIPAASVAANMVPGDWARLMWYRLDSGIGEYPYTVFLGPVEVRYPKITPACPAVITCPVP